jgi:peroxiredoxin
MVKGSKYIAQITQIVIIIALFASCSGCSSDSGFSHRAPIKATGLSAPDFTATTIDGEKITLSDFKGKKAVVLDIWATWCGPCRMEMPDLQKIYEKYSDQVEIIAVSQDQQLSDLSKIKSFVEEFKITFKVIHDNDFSISKRYPTRSIPFVVLIDKDGKIVKRITGYDTQLEQTMVKALKLKVVDTTPTSQN